ncbi:MAG: PilZ domain-containing protein [Deltaproteobacteria bacterium]|nr:PilZ domain-containing protein [Deltaproteobacteria bacterium]
MVNSRLPVERRKWPRAKFFAMARVRRHNGPSDVFGINNLSAGGALLIGDAGYRVGDKIKVSIELPKYGNVSMTALVVRVQTNGQGDKDFAVKFLAPNPVFEDAIQNAVLRELEEIHALGRRVKTTR